MWVWSENIGRVRSQGTLLGSQHFRGRRACWNFGMGLGRNDKQLIHSLESAQTKQTCWLVLSLNIFGARMRHEQPRIHKIHHGPKLGEATTFPLIVFSTSLHGGHIQMAFCLGNPNLESRNSHSWDSCNFGGP
jgi:hypothetical protein